MSLMSLNQSDIQSTNPALYQTIKELINSIDTINKLIEGDIKLESGVFVPVDLSGAGLVFTNPGGYYIKLGKFIFIHGALGYPVTANGSNVTIGGLPFRIGLGSSIMNGQAFGLGVDVAFLLLSQTTNFTLVNNAATIYTNAALSTIQVLFDGCYLEADS